MKYNHLSSSIVQMEDHKTLKVAPALAGDHSILAGGFLSFQNLTNAGGRLTLINAPHIGCRADKNTEALDKCIIFKPLR
jgi:hypothetical protein